MQHRTSGSHRQRFVGQATAVERQETEIFENLARRKFKAKHPGRDLGFETRAAERQSFRPEYFAGVEGLEHRHELFLGEFGRSELARGYIGIRQPAAAVLR